MNSFLKALAPIFASMPCFGQLPLSKESMADAPTASQTQSMIEALDKYYALISNTGICAGLDDKRTYLTGAYVELKGLLEQECILVSDFGNVSSAPWDATAPDHTSDGVAFDGMGTDTWDSNRPNTVIAEGVDEDRCALRKPEMEGYCCEGDLLTCCLVNCPVLSDEEVAKINTRRKAVQAYKVIFQDAFDDECGE